MPLAPEISVAPASTALYSLTIAGNDVLIPVSGGNAPGVPLDTIEIRENGPPGVSSLTFTYEDPLGTGPTMNDGDEVQLWDRTLNVCLFRGWPQSWDTTPFGGGQGRTIHVQCAGIEIALDWAMLLTPLRAPSGTLLVTAAQSCYAAATGVGPLNVASNGTSSQATPLSYFYFNITPAALAYDVTIPAGTSLRAALIACGVASASTAGGYFAYNAPANALFTIDFYGGLRGMRDSAGGAWADDYATLTVNDASSANRAENLDHTIDATAIVRGVYVAGLNAAGSGYLPDGTGKQGQIAFISDTTIDTAAKLLNVQITYLNGAIIGVRGEFDLSDWTPTAGVHPGSLLALTDAATGATGTYRVRQITKTFSGARQNWHITYGNGLPPSLTRLVRSLTRSTTS
jgi:hypothetical protein